MSAADGFCYDTDVQHDKLGFTPVPKTEMDCLRRESEDASSIVEEIADSEKQVEQLTPEKVDQSCESAEDPIAKRPRERDTDSEIVDPTKRIKSDESQTISSTSSIYDSQKEAVRYPFQPQSTSKNITTNVNSDEHLNHSDDQSLKDILRCQVEARRAKLRKNPIMRLMESLNIDSNHYFSAEISKRGGKSSPTSKNSVSVYNRGGNIDSSKIIPRHPSSPSGTIRRVQSDEVPQDDNTSHLSYVNNSSLPGNSSPRENNDTNRILPDSPDNSLMSLSLRGGNSPNRLCGNDSGNVDSGGVQVDQSQMYQKEDTLIWCHQQIQRVKEAYPDKIEKAMMEYNGMPCFHEMILGDAYAGNSLASWEIKGRYRNSDRVTPCAELDEILVSVAVAAKVYIGELISGAAALETADHKRRMKSVSVKTEAKKKDCKDSHSENQDAKVSDTSTSGIKRVLMPHHIYEMARKLASIETK